MGRRVQISRDKSLTISPVFEEMVRIKSTISNLLSSWDEKLEFICQKGTAEYVSDAIKVYSKEGR